MRGTPEECAAEIQRRFGDVAERVCGYFPGYAAAADQIARPGGRAQLSRRRFCGEVAWIAIPAKPTTSSRIVALETASGSRPETGSVSTCRISASGTQRGVRPGAQQRDPEQQLAEVEAGDPDVQEDRQAGLGRRVLEALVAQRVGDDQRPEERPSASRSRRCR